MTIFALLPLRLSAQWTVQPHGWFMSQTISKGTIPDRFDPGVGAIANGLDKVDWGLYFIYGWKEGLSLGLGQGFAHLEDRRNGTSTTTTGFGATGFFAMKRLAQGKAGILSLQPRVDVPLLYDISARPVLGPVKAEGEIRLLYGNGYGLAGHRGWFSTATARSLPGHRGRHINGLSRALLHQHALHRVRRLSVAVDRRLIRRLGGHTTRQHWLHDDLQRLISRVPRHQSKAHLSGDASTDPDGVVGIFAHCYLLQIHEHGQARPAKLGRRRGRALRQIDERRR